MCGPFPGFVVVDFQRGGLIIGYGLQLVKLVSNILKNAIVTGGPKKLKGNSHTVEKMTKVPQGFDFSFLNDEEARKILQVLERNEKLQRAEKDRISKLQKTKRDIRWLQGVTGEWFEEIQRKKFCNETDVSQMLKPPLTYRLTKEMAKNELQTSRSKNLTNQKKTSIASRLSFRSSFASLFSFRKSGKETLKLQSLEQKGYDSHAGPLASMSGTAVQAKKYNSPPENQPVGSAFAPKPAGMREGSGMPSPWDSSLLENEFFQVLDDLDSKLAQEQAASSVNTRPSHNYESRMQFSHVYSSGNRHNSIIGRHKNRYNETSKMSIYDILRPGTPREGFKTFSPRTRTIYDMYRTREPRTMKEDYVQKNTFGSTSLCFDGRQRSASPATGHFTARSLHFPATTQNKSGFGLPTYQQSPKRTPLSSIIWNRSDSSRDRQNQEEVLRAPSPMEIDPVDWYTYPKGFQENRRPELYHSQNIYQPVSLNSTRNNAMSPDIFENSENMPFYHRNNLFARSFFSNTFGRSREQRFEHSPFWGQQKEHFSWPDFHQSRKPFTPDRDFEMISVQENSASAVHGYSVPSQHWGSVSPGTDFPTGPEEPYSWHSNFHTSAQENMEMSQGNGNRVTPHFTIPLVGSMTSSSYHIKSGGMEYQHDSSPVEIPINKEPYSFEMAHTLASSFQTSVPQIPDDTRNPHSPDFQIPTVSLQKCIPDKPDSLPIRSHTEVTSTNNDSVDSLLLAESQPDILITNVNHEKDSNESISEEDKQLSKMDQTSKTGEVLQHVSQTVMSNPLPDFQNPLYQDTARSKRFGLNESTSVSSKRSSRVFSRKDNSQMYIPHRDKASELKKDKNFAGNRKLGLAISPPFIQESRTPPSFLRPNQSCHQELTVSNENISSIIRNNHWTSETVDNKNAQSLEKSVILDTKGEQCTTVHSTNCTKLAASQISCDSFDLSSGALEESSPSNNSFLDTPVIPSTTALFRRSHSDEDPPLGKGETDNVSENQNNQFAVSPSENLKSSDSDMPVHDETVDTAKHHSNSPFKNGRKKGKVRRHISCIEKLSKTESRLTPASDSNSLTEVNQSNPKASGLDSSYCTLPRKSASFLINSRQSENKILGVSLRNGPLPFQVTDHVEDPVGKYTSKKFSPRFPESVSEPSKVISDLVPGASEATERMTNTKITGSASVRKGPLPFLIKRTVSCPAGEPYASNGKDERKKSSVSDTDASAITPQPQEKIINSVESDSSARDHSLTKRHNQKVYSQECTEKDGKTAASRTGTFSLLNADPLPFCSDVLGKESGRTLHKFKTTSMFSVSGDEDNVKCLEVVSVYYTLPRKHSKKFYDLLQQYTQNTNSLIESLQVETETFPDVLVKDKLSYSMHDQSKAPSSEDLKMSIYSAQKNIHCLSDTTENMTVLQLPNRGSSEPMFQEMASVKTDISFQSGDSKAGEIFSDDLSGTFLGDSKIRKERERELQSRTVHSSLMLPKKYVTEEKSENCQQFINSGNGGPSFLPDHSEDNVENPQTGKSSEEYVDSDITILSTGSGKCPQKDITAIAVDDSSKGSQPGQVRGEVGTDCQKMTDNLLSDSESQASALIPALHKLRLVEETYSGDPDLRNLQSEPREMPRSCHDVNMTESRKAKNEMQKSSWDQPSVPEGNNKNKTNFEDLGKGRNRSSAKHRLAAVCKANRKFSSKDLSPRRHVATIFPQSKSRSGFGSLSPGMLECNSLSSKPTPRFTESTDGSRLSNDEMNVKTSENSLQATVISNREMSTHPSDQKPDRISQLHQNDFKHVSELPPTHENSKDAQILEKGSGAPAQFTFSSLRVEGFSDYQERLSPPFAVELAQQSTINIPLASCQKQQESASSLEWEPEPQLHRSRSLKSINVHGNVLRKSHPPKVRERHYSESTSIDNALSQMTLGDEFSINNGYSRRFKSFSELPSSDENENWTLYSSRTKTGPKSTTSISRPIDYGIFGKEQQLAFLENVKRSLTQGRLWKPSFLKNPGFLKDDVINPPNPSESLSSNSPSSQLPSDGLSPSEPLNIYEEDPVDSDCDTDTTTDDEYYLDENDKESEL
ncbi:exophilin-5 isoform X1 [Tupaia chinensis]|nr:exophilin-5 isoform X1 [Tupaia chinensis]